MVKTVWRGVSRLQNYGALNFVQFILGQPVYERFSDFGSGSPISHV